MTQSRLRKAHATTSRITQFDKQSKLIGRLTTQRPWHDLKPGDVVWLATGFYEVFDAYPVSQDSVRVKLIVDGRIESYRVRVWPESMATCRI